MQLRPSQLARWMQCEKQGIHRAHFPPEPGPRVEHVAGWIGSAVHAALAGDSEPIPPKFLSFDDLTPTFAVARAQITRMVPAIEAVLALNDFTPLAHELHLPALTFVGNDTFPDWPADLQLGGTLDLLCAGGPDDAGIVADFKTGRTFEAGWLQIAAYALRYEWSPPDDPRLPVTIGEAAIVHCMRPAVLKPAQATLLRQPIEPLMDEAVRVLNRVIASHLDPESAPATPSERCRFCEHPRCPVRTADYSTRKRN